MKMSNIVATCAVVVAIGSGYISWHNTKKTNNIALNAQEIEKRNLEQQKSLEEKKIVSDMMATLDRKDITSNKRLNLISRLFLLNLGDELKKNITKEASAEIMRELKRVQHDYKTISEKLEDAKAKAGIVKKLKDSKDKLLSSKLKHDSSKGSLDTALERKNSTRVEHSRLEKELREKNASVKKAKNDIKEKGISNIEKANLTALINSEMLYATKLSKQLKENSSKIIKDDKAYSDSVTAEAKAKEEYDKADLLNKKAKSEFESIIRQAA